MRKEAWFGISILIALVVAIVVLMPAPADITNGHLGLLMLALIVVTIMLGFPTAFTLMGMGVMFTYLAYRGMGPQIAMEQTLDLMVLRTYAVMTNDVLIAVPLFIFMGYLVERANLIEKSLQEHAPRHGAVCPARWRWPPSSLALCSRRPRASWGPW